MTRASILVETSHCYVEGEFARLLFLTITYDMIKIFVRDAVDLALHLSENASKSFLLWVPLPRSHRAVREA